MSLRLLAAGALLMSAGAVEAQTQRFHLAPGAVPAGWQAAGPERVYGPGTRFGFEPGRPNLFSVALPEGDYRVTLTFAASSAATVKAEARRLMLQELRTTRAPSRRSFVVNVRTAALPPPPANAPGGTAVRLNPREQGSPTWDDKLTLEFLGDAPRVVGVEIEPVAVPRVFLLGDSTVTDQRYEDGASWGQMLPRFLDERVSVANHAESGETLKSFLTELRLDKVLSQMRPGDWAMIQFGHNDQKAQWPQTYAEAATTYRGYLRLYIDEVRRRGGKPILVTSPHRRSFGPDGRITNSHGGYPDAVRAVARESGVPLVDLHAASAAIYEALGPERAKLAFADGGRDATHHNNYGGYVLAQAVVEGIRQADPALAAHIRPDVRRFDPAHPPAPAAFTLPASTARSPKRPRGS